VLLQAYALNNLGVMNYRQQVFQAALEYFTQVANLIEPLIENPILDEELLDKLKKMKDSIDNVSLVGNSDIFLDKFQVLLLENTSNIVCSNPGNPPTYPPG
jgi:hypothetical protein